MRDLVRHCKDLGLSGSYENRPQGREQGSLVRWFWKQFRREVIMTWVSEEAVEKATSHQIVNTF